MEGITLRVACFNVSMEASNYLPRAKAREPDVLASNVLARHLASGQHPQIRNIAEILQRVRPDIVLLNEFDFLDDHGVGFGHFLDKYLAVSQGGQEPLHYPHWFSAPVNTGVPSPFDIDGDGIASGTGGDAWGFGHYPGQYGMLVLSRYPVQTEQVRTFRYFPWHRMPDAKRPCLPGKELFYDDITWRGLRLSSKSHWDLPIEIEGNVVHLLCAHPTPPVFDGPERRNACRNHDEIRLWADYIEPSEGQYLVDDDGGRGALVANSRFIILGDYNASPDEGKSLPGAINQLLDHPRVNSTFIPTSDGGQAHTPDSEFAASHTANWRARVDYVLPSQQGFDVLDGGVFWPEPGSPQQNLVDNRHHSSDHRLVWLDLTLT